MQIKQPIDNELDIRELCQLVWQGKIIIISVTLLFMLAALLYSMLAQQQWRSSAMMDKPTINMLDQYYRQQYLLNSLDNSAAAKATMPLPESIIGKVYNEFTLQLGAYDTRRAFWLHSSYYKQRQTGDKWADSVLLEKLIEQIQYVASDDKKYLFDTISLIAETAPDARQQLRDYIAFVSQQVTKQLNKDLTASWKMWSDNLQNQLKQQQVLLQQTRESTINRLKQAVAMAEQQNITDNRLGSTPLDSIPETQLFLLGKSLLQLQLNALTSSPLQLDSTYQQIRQSLGQLQSGPVLQQDLQVYRYLQTPEEPIQRDSPRCLFLLLLWGTVGIVVGISIVLGRRVLSLSQQYRSQPQVSQ